MSMAKKGTLPERVVVCRYLLIGKSVLLIAHTAGACKEQMDLLLTKLSLHIDFSRGPSQLYDEDGSFYYGWLLPDALHCFAFYFSPPQCDLLS